MKSSKYWDKRALEREQSTTENSIDAKKKTVNAYLKAKSDIEKEINIIYGTIMKSNGLTRKEVESLLSAKETEEEHERLLKLIWTIENKKERKELLMRINAPAYSYRISRWKALQDEINVLLTKLAEEQIETTTAVLEQTYEDNYYKGIYDMQRGTGIKFSFDKIPKKAVQEAIATPWQNLHYSESIWKNTDKLKKSLAEIIPAGITSGKGYFKLAAELDEIMDAGIGNAMRIIRTELNHAHNQAELKSCIEMGVKKYRFIATLDRKTCKTCGKKDNKLFFVKNAKVGENIPPIHPNDRCTITGVVNEDAIERMTRRAKDPITGEIMKISGDVSWEDWIKDFDSKAVDRLNKKDYNLNADKEQFNRYKAIMNKEFPSKFADFQKMKYDEPEKWNEYKSLARKNNHLQSKLNYTHNGEKLFIPKNAKFDKVVTIAGNSTKAEIRCVDKLIEKYGGDSDNWEKRAGRITSDKYMFDVHWYERDGVQYEIKLKVRKERK